MARTGHSPAPEGLLVASGGSEDERGGVQEITANNDKIIQGSSWFWLLTNSDEVNLNLQKIDKKVDKLNAGSLGEQNR